MIKIAKIDGFGRILIPKGLRESLGLREQSVVVLEEKEDYLLMRPAHGDPGDIVESISRMNLPVGDWEEMEEEIAKGRLDE